MWLPRLDHLNEPILNVMNFLNEVTLWYPSAISFAPGRPAEQFFHVQAALEYIARYIEHTAGMESLPPADCFDQIGQYQKTNGIINRLVCRFLEQDEKIHTTPDAIMITDGCQEAMMIALAGLFDPARDVLLSADPIYIGITGIAVILGVEVCPVLSGTHGLDLDALAVQIEAIRARGKAARALYLIPDFNNPLGTSMPLTERQRLLEIAHLHDLLIIEDNAYGMFAYDAERPPTLKSLDQENRVIYLGTFSKILFPGLRIGFMVADQQIVSPEGKAGGTLADVLSKVKSLTTVTTSPLLQAIVGGALLAGDCSLNATMPEKIRFYRRNRDTMLACLDRHFSGDPLLAGAVEWNRPGGGFFLTVTLPFVFTEDLLRLCAQQYGVICCPMSFFSLLPGRENQIRLSFSYVRPDEIERGIYQFWRFIHDQIELRVRD